MSRRKYHRVELCDEPGCKEARHYEYDLKRDYLEACDRERTRKHWCPRHDPVSGNIKPHETERVIRTVYLAKRAEKYPKLTTLFFGKNGGEAFNGLVSGEGYNAYANDFPEGTEIIVETRITVKRP